MSSNMRDNFDPKQTHKPHAHLNNNDPQLHHNLELIWSILSQRFVKLADAFRFFDMDDNKQLDFIEFFSGLDKLRIKMSLEDAMKCFEYLNKEKGDGLLDYN